MSEIVETFDSLWAYCTANDRLVPMPDYWARLYGMLRNTSRKPSERSVPPAPLILGAWHYSMPLEKQLRFKEHLEWAESEGQIEEIGKYLRALSEAQWCHFGED